MKTIHPDNIISYRITNQADISYFEKGTIPDESWKYVDTHGHIHQWVDGKVPTLKKIIDGYETWYSEDGDEYRDEIYHHECVQCGETVEPKYTYSAEQVAMKGPDDWRLNFTTHIREASGFYPGHQFVFDIQNAPAREWRVLYQNGNSEGIVEVEAAPEASFVGLSLSSD